MTDSRGLAADHAPQPPSGDLQLPCSFEDVLDIFPLSKPISPDLPYGGSRWQVLDMAEEEGEESATGVAEAAAGESLGDAELEQQALDGDKLFSPTKSIARGAQLVYGRIAGSPQAVEHAPPQPPSGDLQLPCSFDDALDIFPLCKPISPDLPFGGSRWQVLDMAEEDREESAAGVAEATANESLERAELQQQALDGDEVLSATGITALSTLWTSSSQLQHEGDNQLDQLALCVTTGPTMDESFAAACSTMGDGVALKKLQVKTPWTKHEDQAILEGVKVPRPVDTHSNPDRSRPNLELQPPPQPQCPSQPSSPNPIPTPYRCTGTSGRRSRRRCHARCRGRTTRRATVGTA